MNFELFELYMQQISPGTYLGSFACETNRDRLCIARWAYIVTSKNVAHPCVFMERYAREKKVDPYAELKKAHAEGKTIQYSFKSEWINCPSPMWVRDVSRYRVKPDPDLDAMMSDPRN